MRRPATANDSQPTIVEPHAPHRWRLFDTPERRGSGGVYVEANATEKRRQKPNDIHSPKATLSRDLGYTNEST